MRNEAGDRAPGLAVSLGSDPSPGRLSQLRVENSDEGKSVDYMWQFPIIRRGENIT